MIVNGEVLLEFPWTHNLKDRHDHLCAMESFLYTEIFKRQVPTLIDVNTYICPQCLVVQTPFDLVRNRAKFCRHSSPRQELSRVLSCSIDRLTQSQDEPQSGHRRPHTGDKWSSLAGFFIALRWICSMVVHAIIICYMAVLATIICPLYALGSLFLWVHGLIEVVSSWYNYKGKTNHSGLRNRGKGRGLPVKALPGAEMGERWMTAVRIAKSTNYTLCQDHYSPFYKVEPLLRSTTGLGMEHLSLLIAKRANQVANKDDQDTDDIDSIDKDILRRDELEKEDDNKVSPEHVVFVECPPFSLECLCPGTLPKDASYSIALHGRASSLFFLNLRACTDCESHPTYEFMSDDPRRPFARYGWPHGVKHEQS